MFSHNSDGAHRYFLGYFDRVYELQIALIAEMSESKQQQKAPTFY